MVEEAAVSAPGRTTRRQVMELLYATLRTHGLDGTPMWLNARLTTAHKHAWWNIWHRTQRQGGINGELQEWTQRVWLPWVEAAWRDADTRDSVAAKQRAQEAPTDVPMDSQPDVGR